jgi:hypothetical protein
MAEYEKKVREILKQNGFIFHHHGKGDHDVWINELFNEPPHPEGWGIL